DPFRASVAVQLIPRLALADEDVELGEALDRWELALFQSPPFRDEQLSQSLTSALGGGDGQWAAAMRAAALLGQNARDRADLVERLRSPSTDLVRRVLVELLLHGDRRSLVRELDDSLV